MRFIRYEKNHENSVRFHDIIIHRGCDDVRFFNTGKYCYFFVLIQRRYIIISSCIIYVVGYTRRDVSPGFFSDYRSRVRPPFFSLFCGRAQSHYLATRPRATVAKVKNKIKNPSRTDPLYAFPGVFHFPHTGFDVLGNFQRQPHVTNNNQNS